MIGGSCGNLRSVRYTARTCLNTDPASQNPSESGDGISTIAVLAAVLSLGCLLVGAVGFVMPYARPRLQAPRAPAVRAQLIKVELTSAPLLAAPSYATVPLNLSQPPRPVAMPAVAAAPPLVALNQPIPVIPITVQAVAVAHFSGSNSTTSIPPAPPPVDSVGVKTGTNEPRTNPALVPAAKMLTFGVGDGKQPAPKYPDTARRAGQEGTVAIRFTVTDEGHVLAAEASVPSPWDSLNREALRVVREQWRFLPGPVRLYEVAIRFELKK